MEPAVAKQDAEGVLAVHRDRTVAEVPPTPVEVRGPMAGDVLGGSLCHGLLVGRDLDREAIP